MVDTLEMEYILDPVTKETIHPRIALPEGLVVKERRWSAVSSSQCGMTM